MNPNKQTTTAASLGYLEAVIKNGFISAGLQGRDLPAQPACPGGGSPSHTPWRGGLFLPVPMSHLKLSDKRRQKQTDDLDHGTFPFRENQVRFLIAVLRLEILRSDQ